MTKLIHINDIVVSLSLVCIKVTVKLGKVHAKHTQLPALLIGQITTLIWRYVRGGYHWFGSHEPEEDTIYLIILCIVEHYPISFSALDIPLRA